MGTNAGNVSARHNPNYDRMVALAWKEFKRDVKNSTAKSRPLKHQKYFEGKLVRMSDDPTLKRRATMLLPFIRGRMMINHQPYRKLAELSRAIDCRRYHHQWGYT